MTESEWLSSDDPGRMLQLFVGTPGERWRSGMEAEPPEPPQYPASDRKLRLFAAACCRAAGHHVEDWEESGPLLIPDSAWAERWAVIAQLPVAVRAALLRDLFGNPFRPVVIEIPGALGTPMVQWPAGRVDALYVVEQMRDQPLIVRRSWLTPTVRTIAEGVYRDRDFSPAALGELWDAIADAGCDNEDMRRHLAGEERCPECLGKGERRYEGLNSRIAKCYDCKGGWRPAATCPECKGKGQILGVQKCQTCHGAGRVAGGHVRGCWVLDILLGKA